MGTCIRTGHTGLTEPDGGQDAFGDYRRRTVTSSVEALDWTGEASSRTEQASMDGSCWTGETSLQASSVTGKGLEQYRRGLSTGGGGATMSSAQISSGILTSLANEMELPQLWQWLQVE